MSEAHYWWLSYSLRDWWLSLPGRLGISGMLELRVLGKLHIYAAPAVTIKFIFIVLHQLPYRFHIICCVCGRHDPYPTAATAIAAIEISVYTETVNLLHRWDWNSFEENLYRKRETFGCPKRSQHWEEGNNCSSASSHVPDVVQDLAEADLHPRQASHCQCTVSDIIDCWVALFCFSFLRDQEDSNTLKNASFGHRMQKLRVFSFSLWVV